MRSRRSATARDGRVLALNSYENRVYQVGIDEGAPVVVKFYRPGRWTDAAILEEHAFALELAAQEIPGGRAARARGRRRCTLHDGLSLRRSFRAAAAAGPNSARPTTGNGSGAFSGASTRVGRAGALRAPRRAQHRGAGARSRAISCSTGDWMPDYLADKYADRDRDAARGGRERAPPAGAAPPRTDPRRLPSRQHPLDRCRAAFRRSRRLPDRARDPGPVDAARRQPRRRCAAQLRRSADGLRAVPPFDRARTRADRAAAGPAHDPLRGLARAPLARPGVSRRPFPGSPSRAIGRSTTARSRSSWPRCSSRRSSCERRSYVQDHPGRMDHRKPRSPRPSCLCALVARSPAATAMRGSAAGAQRTRRTQGAGRGAARARPPSEQTVGHGRGARQSASRRCRSTLKFDARASARAGGSRSTIAIALMPRIRPTRRPSSVGGVAGVRRGGCRSAQFELAVGRARRRSIGTSVTLTPAARGRAAARRSR